MISKNQLDLLQAMADVQAATSIQMVEDSYLAEETDLEIGFIQYALETLSQEGYVHLERVERLSGSGYMVSLLPKGEALLQVISLSKAKAK
jgi:DNA-binding MarR family transcriptional regulator